MSRMQTHITIALAIALLSAAAAYAGDSPDEIKQRMGTGNPVAGKEKSAMCQGCHGENGNSTSSDYPKLAGQYAAYIQKQVNNFKAGSRTDPVMSGMAATVTEDQDLLDIAAYFSSQHQMKSAKPVANKSGQERFTDPGNGCATCHGVNGKGLAPDKSQAPVIGGQHKDYLVKQLNNFRSGARRNDPGGMMGIVAGFMTDEEIEDVASYISGL